MISSLPAKWRLKNERRNFQLERRLWLQNGSISLLVNNSPFSRGGGGSTPFYKPYGYVPPQSVGFLLSRRTEFCKADRNTWQLTLGDINTTPKEPKTERSRSPRQLFRFFWASSVRRNEQRGSDVKSPHTLFWSPLRFLHLLGLDAGIDFAHFGLMNSTDYFINIQLISFISTCFELRDKLISGIINPTDG